VERKVYEFISKQLNDPIVERKTCAVSGEPFAIFQSDLDFYKKISPTFARKKYQILAPNISPSTIMNNLLSFRNESNLYRRKCDLTWKYILSVYSPDKPYKVYDQEAWRSDKWDALDYGCDFDFSKTFAEQFKALQLQVPRVAMLWVNNENSEYTNPSYSCKNCYLIFGSAINENCLYGKYLWHNNNCIDNLYLTNSELCYECIDCEACYNLKFWHNCEHCSGSYFLKNCKNCQHCFGCANLINGQYCLFNKALNKEEYNQEIKNIYDGTYPSIQNAKSQFADFCLKNPVKNLQTIASEKSFGDCLQHTKSCQMCYNVIKAENGKYLWNCEWVNNSQHCFRYDTGDLGYQIISGGGDDRTKGITLNNLFGSSVWNCSNVYYCDHIQSCNNCFACIGLKNKEYCIFNKQYIKSDYETLAGQLIDHMIATGERWKFFPSQMSCFGYNESIAMEYFPLTKDEAIKKWFQRSEYEAPFPKVERTLKADELPDIKNVTDDILQQAIACEVSWKPFKILKLELEFYKKNKLPLPRLHPDTRHEERNKQRPARNMYARICDKCWIEMLSVYTPDSEFKVYCEACYNKEIYW